MEPWHYVLLTIFLLLAGAWFIHWARVSWAGSVPVRAARRLRPHSREQSPILSREAEKALADLGVAQRCYSSAKRADIGKVGYWHAHEDSYGFPYRDCPSCGRSDSVLVEIVPAFDGHASIRKIGTICTDGACGRVRIEGNSSVLPIETTKARTVAQLIEILKAHPLHMPRAVVASQLAEVELAIRQSEKRLEQLDSEREELKLRLMAYDRPPNDGGPYRGSGLPPSAEPEKKKPPNMGGGWDVTFLPTIN